eukprot:3242252-Amphidinium_carterae.1
MSHCAITATSTSESMIPIPVKCVPTKPTYGILILQRLPQAPTKSNVKQRIGDASLLVVVGRAEEPSPRSRLANQLDVGLGKRVCGIVHQLAVLPGIQQ